jgi:peptidyl-prolyl isomerase D
LFVAVVVMRRADRIKISVFLTVCLVGVLRLYVTQAPSVSVAADTSTPAESDTPPRRLHAVSPPAKAAISFSPPSPPLVSSRPPPPHAQAPPKPEIDKCYTHTNTEYDGQVVLWGPHNVVKTAAECCEKCRSHRASEEAAGKSSGCTVWVFCPREEGCGSQKFGECWGKTHPADGTGAERSAQQLLPRARAKGEGVAWVSGAVFTPEEAQTVAQAEVAAARALAERRDRVGNPKVFFEVKISHGASKGEAAHSQSALEEPGAASGGRIEFVLYAHESPRHAENFRAMCTGEKGGKHTFKGMKFYRIIDMFIDQAGAGPGSIWGRAFDDDPGGLKLRHDRAGLLSSANGGPNTNSGHFSIVVSPAPHLDGGYTIFGEVVSGMDVVMEINKLDKRRPGGSAFVVDAGCIANCDPRPEVTPQCAHRASERREVQGRKVNPCLD